METVDIQKTGKLPSNISDAPTDSTPTALQLGPVIERPLAELTPWPKNPRKHSDKQIAMIMASIHQFGFLIAVLIDEFGVILCGHARVLAAKALGLLTVPVRVISGMTESQKRAFVITDNKSVLLASWDEALLKEELAVLIEVDYNVEVTGFSTAEIDIMFDASAGQPQADPGDLQPEDVIAEVVSRPGDLWGLAKHYMYCGDALHAKSYQVVMLGELAQMAITDPPYNVKISGHVCAGGKHDEFPMASGEMSSPVFTTFLGQAMFHIHALSQNGAINFFCMDWRHIRELLDAAQPLYGAPRQMCVWVKDNGGMGTFYRSQHELVFAFKKGDAKHINNFELGQHGRYRTNVWNYPGVNTFTGKGYELLAMHPTVKPVSLIADAMRDCSHRKGIILDPFAGSGTVLIAAERTGRYARAIELDPKYVDVAVMRWQRVTGQQAVLVSTGQTWEQVRQARLSTNL